MERFWAIRIVTGVRLALHELTYITGQTDASTTPIFGKRANGPTAQRHGLCWTRYLATNWIVDDERMDCTPTKLMMDLISGTQAWTASNQLAGTRE